MQGYKDYLKALDIYELVSEEETMGYLKHRQKLLDKMRIEHTIDVNHFDPKLLRGNSDLLLSQLKEMMESCIFTTYGASFNHLFFLLNAFEGLIVDAKNVILIGYSKRFIRKQEVNLYDCVFITNDPYVPVFYMTVGEPRHYSTKWYSAEENIIQLFSKICPNLICDITELLILEQRVKDCLEIDDDLRDLAIESIESYLGREGFFKNYHITYRLNKTSIQMMNDIGYYTKEQIGTLFQLTEASKQKLWRKHILSFMETK
jgi:hypothetical protein